MPWWAWTWPVLAWGVLATTFASGVGGTLVIVADAAALIVTVFAAVYHAEVVGERVGEPFGSLAPAPPRVQAMRTEIRRPGSSMRLNAWTATSTSVARRRSVRERSQSRITCLNLPMAASARACFV